MFFYYRIFTHGTSQELWRPTVEVLYQCWDTISFKHWDLAIKWTYLIFWHFLYAKYHFAFKLYFGFISRSCIVRKKSGFVFFFILGDKGMILFKYFLNQNFCFLRLLMVTFRIALNNCSSFFPSLHFILFCLLCLLCFVLFCYKSYMQ